MINIDTSIVKTSNIYGRKCIPFSDDNYRSDEYRSPLIFAINKISFNTIWKKSLKECVLNSTLQRMMYFR